jgi:uncharacterized protein
MLLVLDGFLFWSGRKSIGRKWPVWLKWTFSALYWAVPATLVTLFAIVATQAKYPLEPRYWDYAEWGVGLFVLVYVGKFFYAAAAIPLEVVGLFMKRNKERFLKAHRLVSIVALILIHFHFIAVSKGIRKGRFDYQVRTETIESDKIPAGFDGFKILHFSDLHLGSFIGHEDQIRKAFDLIEAQNADLVLFSGDLVNIQSNEALHFKSELKQLVQNTNLYAVLGNHDYMGHSVNPETTNHLRDEIVDLYNEIGANLMLNQSEYLYRNGDSIVLAGVENWGIPPFPPYGDVEKALHGKPTDSIFTVLLSHDPSHWENKVKTKIPVDLTLSGHTHGMQYVFKIGNFKWSPVSLKYRYWSGLYKEGNQFLNVSTGLGFIAFPGRVGVPPELCIIELKKKVASN